MHSFLLIGKNESVLQEKVDALCAAAHITFFDKTVLLPEKSIGIEDIRTIQKNLSLAPIKSAMKAAIIWHAESLTIPAQNAFLKTLEEPPAHTLIVLIASTKEALLPTVLSRCSVWEQKPEKEDTIPTVSALSLPTSLGEQLYISQTYGKNKETALAWIETSLSTLRTHMLQDYSIEKARDIRQLIHAYTLLRTTNTTPRFVLENFFLVK